MNPDIVLDGKQYRTLAKQWNPEINRPATVRFTITGQIDATFAGFCFLRWNGMVAAPVTPDTADCGSIDDLRVSLTIGSLLAFIDHYGHDYTVAALGPFTERSLSPMWDQTSNMIYVMVQLIGKG